MKVDHFHWRCIAAGPAQCLRSALAELVAPAGGLDAEVVYRCVVCDQGFDGESVDTHLGGMDHYAAVRRLLPDFAAEVGNDGPRLESLWRPQAPWVQEFGS